MGFYAEPWLREARDHIKLAPDNTTATKSGLADFGKLADAVEKAIKAALVENHGSIPRQWDNQNLVSICRATGVWDVLPPALKGLVKEVELFRSANAASSQEGNNDASAQQLQRYFIIARGLIDYMEFHVIGNDSVLKRLKVA